MAITVNRFMSAVLALVLLIMVSLDSTGAQIGVDYGRNGKGLPSSPREVVDLYKKYGIQRMRIYDTDQQTLEALRGSNIDLTVGILNPNLKEIAASQDNANAWVQNNIIKYKDVRFKHIVVGNEVFPIVPETSQYVNLVLPAMKNVHKAISDNHLADQIKVSTAIGSDVIDPSHNFPPENGVFRQEVTPFLNPIIRFLVETKSPLFATIYPYFAYLSNPKIDVRYALLDPNYPGENTPSGKYQNLFYAMLDTMYAALEKSIASMSLEMGGDAIGSGTPEIKGAETGHPTEDGGGKRASVGDDVKGFASVENAKMYVNNLIQAVKKGTPKRPGQPIETYIFAMFDEDMKPGKEEERHFGLFKSNGQPKYPVKFN